MAGPHTRPRVRLLVVAVAAVAFVVLALLAAIADSRAVGGTPVFTTLDIAVGCIFVGAAVIAVGDNRERLVFGAVGAAWLAGSVLAEAQSLHQGLLVVALLTFPSGRLSGIPRRMGAVGAVAVAFGVLPQLWVAALFAAAAIVALVAARGAPAAVFPAVSGSTVAAVLLFTWWSVRNSSLSPLVLYESALIAVAIGFPFATRRIARFRALLTDTVLGDERLAGLPGLRLVLADALGDPGLSIDLWDSNAAGYVDPDGRSCPGVHSLADLRVFDGDQLLARVVTSSSAVLDGPTAQAVGTAVRLTVVNSRLHDLQVQRVADVRASRARLLAAADRERERIAERLRTETGVFLQGAIAELAGRIPASNVETSALIELAAVEIATAADEILRIVSGVPAVPLGDGRLDEAIGALAARSPLPVTVEVAEGMAADGSLETTLFYVCSEALANAAKHSAATQVVIDLRRDGEQILLSVHDDGRGGADSGGSGLQGLAARLAAVGGHFALDSPAGGGTTVSASLPASDGGQLTTDGR